MVWVQLAILLVNLLRDLRKSRTEEEFLVSPTATRLMRGGDGEFLKWLWAQREEILVFVLRIMEEFFPSDRVEKVSKFVDEMLDS